ncbi:hypothetical protein DFR42_104217 [Undibacterium pigrum]|uniref:Uncharacterized protein n=1 Tax=Undibacterium pigrum TaxID=401470 RepID=A0A318J3M1_9BURK|nr:hypothetical protein DFR42_104217 [Undibacterium pigrum]
MFEVSAVETIQLSATEGLEAILNSHTASVQASSNNNGVM